MEDRPQGDDDPLAVTRDLVATLLTLSRALVALSAQSLVGVDGTLTLSEFRALVVLRSQGAARTQGLSQRLGLTRATTARITTRLVALGFVTEDESEAHRLTATGTEVVDAVTSRRRALLTDVVARMSLDEQRALIDSLLAFARAAGEPIVAVDDEDR